MKALFLTLVVLSGVTPASAQRHSTLGLGAGVVVPTGAFGSEVDPGWQLSGFAEIPFGSGPVRLRVELNYARFGAAQPGQNPRMIPLLVAFKFANPASGAQPYLLLGTGAYYFKTANPTFDDNKFGVNFGLGVARQRLFLEGRYHSVFTRRDSYFAISVGARL